MLKVVLAPPAPWALLLGYPPNWSLLSDVEGFGVNCPYVK